MKKETMFWVIFESTTSKSDRMAMVTGNKTPRDLFNWIVNERKEIESVTGKSFIVINCGMINN